METDPTGRIAGEPGAKLDFGKVRAALVLSGFARALWAVCEVGTYGATGKYSPRGWEKVPDGEIRYDDAQMRHKLLEWMGESRDKDSGLKHAAQAAWNALARLELMLREEDANLQNNKHGVCSAENVPTEPEQRPPKRLQEPEKDKDALRSHLRYCDCLLCRAYRVSTSKMEDKPQRSSNIWKDACTAGFRRNTFD